MRRQLVHLAAAAAVAFSATARPAPTAATFPTDDKNIVHLLNRAAFGPRPGDVAKVREIGIERYIDQQLHPEKIVDPALDARVVGLTTVGMSQRQIVNEFEIPQQEMRRERQLAAKTGAD